MSDLISIGTSGVRAYSKALQTVGDNVANANTNGYVRRDIRLAEPGAASESALYRGQVLPGGVRVEGVVRAADAWLIEDARMAGGEAAYGTAKLPWLEAVERTLADGDAGVGRGMTALFNRIDELTADPQNLTRRQAVLGAVEDLAATFRRTAVGLGDTAEGITARAGGEVAALNTDVAALQRLNDGLRRAREGSTNQASLLDERDRLLDRITAAAPMQVAFEPTGAATLSLGGQSLTSVALTVSTDGRLAFNPLIAGGSLGGLADAAAHVAQQRSALDAQAGEFATALNMRHGAGRDLNGNAGRPLLAGTSAATLVAAVLAPADFAAADASGTNGNALRFADLRGSGGAEQRWENVVAMQSQAVANARAQDTVATARRDGAAAARDARSAVDLDREAAELLRFQQAYDASARVLQVARETMQSIFNAL